MKELTFPKSERLCSRKDIRDLFASGKRIYVAPLQMVYRFCAVDGETGDGALNVMVSVSKRNFRRAHDRNRLKRQIREAWRLSRHVLPEKKINPSVPEKTNALHIAFIYQSGEKLPWNVILEAMQKALNTLAGKLKTK